MEILGNLILIILFCYVILRLIELYHYEERYEDFDLKLTADNIKNIFHNCLVYTSKKIKNLNIFIKKFR